MYKDHIAIRCPHCGERMLIDWPTPRIRGVRVMCPACAAGFLVAEAVERTVIGADDGRNLHLVGSSQSDRVRRIDGGGEPPAAAECVRKGPEQRRGAADMTTNGMRGLWPRNRRQQ
jgi:ribosomal protein S27AE